MKTQEPALTFPCEFPIKVVGKAHDDFEIEVLSIIRKHFPDLKETALQTRDSREGTYLAITITVTAKDQATLDAVYHALSASDHVLFAL